MSTDVATPAAVPVLQASRIGLTGFAIGLAIVGAVAIAALFGNALAPSDPFTQDLNNRLIPPFWMEGTQAAHPLGTDPGADVLPAAPHAPRSRGSRTAFSMSASMVSPT